MDVEITPLEYERTSRQRRLDGFNQDNLYTTHVMVIGAGGLGCPVIQSIAAAGIGHITIIDHDTVSMSNIQRQTLFSTQDIGEPKAEIAAQRAQLLQPNITITPQKIRVTAENIMLPFLRMPQGHW